MIQRIQSVYLLLVTVLLVVAICMPVGQFIGADGVTAHVFKPLGVALAPVPEDMEDAHSKISIEESFPNLYCYRLGFFLYVC